MFEVIINNKFREIYPSMSKAVLRVYRLLYTISKDSSLLKYYTFETTRFAIKNTQHCKRAVWNYPFLNIKILLKQTSKGDINKKLLEGVINDTLKNETKR